MSEAANSDELIIHLFEVVEGELKETRHCHALKFLKVIMQKFPDNYIDMYKYIYYMSCPDPVHNPYFNMNEVIREEAVIRDNELDIDTELPEIIIAIAKCGVMYKTPALKAHEAIRGMIENMLEFVRDAKFTSGRDGNVNELLKIGKEFKAIREEYRETTRELHEEQKEAGKRGGGDLAYDLSGNSTRDDD